jgi:hypothetical protein
MLISYAEVGAFVSVGSRELKVKPVFTIAYFEIWAKLFVKKDDLHQVEKDLLNNLSF